MSSSSNGPRYAPEDPTLPKPWRGLIDGKTGYLYFWNPETNVTQYERPVVKPPTEKLPPPPPPKGNMPVSSSVHVQPSSGSSRHGHYRGSREVDDRDTGSRSNHHHQSQRGGSGSQSQSQANGVVYGASHGYNLGHGSQGSRSSAKQDSSETGVGLSTEAYRRQHEITILGDSVPVPYMTFESTGFPSEILREVQHAGFSAPTPIQAQSWPIAMQSRDLIAVAKTGSGKTLGYLFPGFMHLSRLRNNPKVGPTVLVLAPTRELATQILDEAVKFGRSSKISSTCLYGGAPKGPQLRDIDRGIDVVVATPGRLNDILEMRRISLKQVSYLVLDEADRMLDMGFEPQIRKIVKEIPSRRQTLMFTATWPKEVRKIAAELLVKPIQVNIGSIDELVANKAITQYVELIMPIEKQRRLEQILRSQEAGSKVLIFCSTKRMCDQLSRNLARQFGAAAIHGDKSQHERDLVLGQFRTGRSPILVATDVAARGLDIKDVRVVINYDFPTGIEDYVHRIGRTGRAGATGVSYTFFSEQDSKHASDLVKVLEGADQRVPREIREMSSRGRGGRGKFRRWAAASDGGRSRDNRNDSGYGGRDHGVDSSFGRSEGDRGVREESDRDRHGDIWGRDLKSVTGMNDRKDEDRDAGHGCSRSPYTNKDRGVAVRDAGRARSRSPGINKDRGGVTDRDVGRARSRSPRISKDHGGVGDRELGHARSRSPTINKDRSGVGSKRGRSRSRSRDHRQSPSRRTHNRGHQGAVRRSRSRSRGRAHSPVQAMSRRSRSRSHGRGTNRSDRRSRSRSRDRGRSTERGVSRSPSRSRRRVGGAFKGEQSIKDSTIAPRRLSPADARSEPKAALHQQAENRHILEPMHIEPEQSSSLVDKHTVYVSGHGLSPTPMQDISQPHSCLRSPSPIADVSRSLRQSTADVSRSSLYRHSRSPIMDGSRSPSYRRIGSPQADGPRSLADHRSPSPRVDDGSRSHPYYRSSSPPDDRPQFPPYRRSSSPPDDKPQFPPYHRSSSPPDDRPQLPPYRRHSSSPPDHRPQLPPYHGSSSPPDDRPQLPPHHRSPSPMEDGLRSQPYRNSPGPIDDGPQSPTQRLPIPSDDGPRSPSYHRLPFSRGGGQMSPHHPPSSREEKMHSPLQWQTGVAAPLQESSREHTSYDHSGKPANDMAGNGSCANQVDDEEEDKIIPSDEGNLIRTSAREG